MAWTSMLHKKIGSLTGGVPALAVLSDIANVLVAQTFRPQLLSH